MNGQRDLEDRTFVVVGASGGIGSATFDLLASRGARLVAAGRDAARLEEVAKAADSSMTFPLDARSFDEVESCLRAAQDLGSATLSGVALCVGSILLKPAQATSPDEWRDVIDTNLTSAFAVVRAAAKTMRGGGSVVLCSTAAASVGLARHEAIAAAKAGVEGLTRSAAAAHAARGLRFNAVAPGLVRTRLAAHITESPSALEASIRMHPAGRIGEPADVASAITWLLDPQNSWVTGEILHVDGGLAQLRPVQRA